MNHSMIYIYEVYKEKSFSQAAKNLFVSQPALSACIKKAEAEIGLQIFDRSSLPIRLTEAGELYIQAIQKIMAAEKDLRRQLNGLSNLEHGHLVIAGTNFFSAFMLPPIISAFIHNYPGIDINLIESDSNTLYSELLQDNIDLILDAGEYDHSLFASDFLFTEQILFAVPAQNPLNKKHAKAALSYDDILCGSPVTTAFSPKDMQDFRGERLILLKKGHDMNARSLTICEHAGFRPGAAMYLNQLSTVASMAEQGIGCCFLTDTLIRRMPLKKDSLIFYPLDDRIAHRDVFIAYQNHPHKTKAMESFILLAKEIYPSCRPSAADPAAG